MSSINISKEGAVNLDHDKPLVPDIALSAISNIIEGSNVTENSVTNETFSLDYHRTICLHSHGHKYYSQV